VTAPARARSTEDDIIKKHCPKCQSARVHRSHRKNSFDRTLCAVGGEIRRCHDCRSRQIWFGPLGLTLPTHGASGGLASVLLVLSTLVVSVFFVWWMISRFRELAG
jgi:hypothetical protein